MEDKEWENFSWLVSQHNKENYVEETSLESIIHGGHAQQNIEVASHAKYYDVEDASRSSHGNNSTSNHGYVTNNSSHGNILTSNHNNNTNDGRNEITSHGVRNAAQRNSEGNAHGSYRVEAIVNNDCPHVTTTTEEPSKGDRDHFEFDRNEREALRDSQALLEVARHQNEVVIDKNEAGRHQNEVGRDQSEAVKEIVSNVWEHVDESIPLYVQKYKERTYETKSGWKIVRIFISSTFTDFFAEREIIVKKVMPELQEWADEKKVQIIECDLRWGVPKNTTFADTIGIMMNELDRCIEETSGQPFFVCLLGERYGWVPTRRYVSDDVIDEYDWVYPTSMTHMELIHGALRTMSTNAMFVLRDKESLASLPDKFKSAFYDRSLLATESMKRLKEELHKRFPGQTFNYKSKISGVDEDTGKVSFEGLEGFQSQMVEYFKSKIDEYLQEQPTNSSASPAVTVMNEEKVQEVFVQKRGEFLIGRDKEMRMLTDFLRIDETKITQTKESKAEENVNEREGERKRICFVIAEPGTGKAAFLANFVLKLKKNNVPFLWNFTSSSPGSTDSVAVLRRFCEQLAARLGEPELPDASANLYHDYDDLKKRFRDLLQSVSTQYPGFPIILHAIHEFQDHWGKSGDWFPVPSAELNVRFIISLVPDPDDDDFSILMRDFEKVSMKFVLPGLDIPNRKELVSSYFDRFNKKLDVEQSEELISHPGSSSPLWLSLACDEIRIFGIYENLTTYIRGLPGQVPELLKSIFQRIMKEDETKKFTDALCCICCSDLGLSESELRWLLSDNEDERLPMLTWATVFRQLKRFIQNTSAAQIRMYTFFHEFVPQVVNEMFLETNEKTKWWHRKIANYFLQEGRDHFRTSNTILWHLQKAEMGKEILKFFRKDRRSLRLSSQTKWLTLRNFRCKQRIYGPAGNFGDRPLYICSFCDMRKLTSASPQRANEICFLCGVFLPPFHRSNPQMCSQATLCRSHSGRWMHTPTTVNCYFCNQMFVTNQRSPVPLYFPLLCCLHCKGACVEIV